MLVDAHTHIQPHGYKPPVDRALLVRYVETALANGLDGLVITEHLFRFHEAYDQLYGWWDADPDPLLAATAAAYWQDHTNLRLSEYVSLIEAAKSAGLPIFLGLEMDWLPGRAEDLRRILAPYTWDVVLGGIHWIGAFGFDSGESLDEWDRRDVDTVYEEYGQLLTELADSGLADVLVHADRPKVFGHLPRDRAPLHDRIVAAAVRNNCAIEINTNGLRHSLHELYPAQDVLVAAHAAGVPITLGSDAHTPDRLGQAFATATAAARAAGYGGYTRYVGRRPVFEAFTG